MRNYIQHETDDVIINLCPTLSLTISEQYDFHPYHLEQNHLNTDFISQKVH